jgi:nucleoporin GLE1
MQAAANRTFHLSLARVHSSSPSPATKPSGDISSIQSLLSQLDLRQRTETAALHKSFEARNKSLWDSIEASILAAEAEEGERQRVLKEKREKEEEQERKAKEMRELAEKKAKEDAAKEAERAEEEKKKLEEKQKKDEEERKKKAEAEAAAAAKASAAGLPSGSAEGSPQAEFERWTAKMAVRPLSFPFFSSSPRLTPSSFAAHQIGSTPCCLPEPRLAESLLHCQTCHHSQNWSTHLLLLRHPPHHHPTRRAPLLHETLSR